MKHGTVRSKFFLIFVATIFVAGCTLDFALPTNELMHLSVFKSGHPIYERDLGITDPVSQAINRWLAANPDGWEYAFMTREPRIYLKGKYFYVNISEDEVLVKYCRVIYDCNLWVKKSNDLFSEIKKLTQTR